MKKLFLVSVLGLLAASAVQAYQPTEIVVPVPTALMNITNQTLITNTAAAFTFPPASAPGRLVINVTGNNTNQFTVGFNTAADPNGTNFSCNVPFQVVFTPVTNSFGASQVYSAYVPATNFDGLVKGRFDYASSLTPGLTITGLKFEFNF
jgi:hypothetical protein